MSYTDEAIDLVLSTILEEKGPAANVHPSAEKLVLHARGALPPEDSERLASHLAVCAPCRALRLEVKEFDDEAIDAVPAWVIAAAEKTAVGAQARRVLIVEDDAPMATLLRRVLEKAGFQVQEVHRGDRALECLGNDDVSLVLLDYRLPDMTGADVVAALGERIESLPVVMVTGFPSPEVIGQMMGAGVDDYLVKDTDMDFLHRLPTVVEAALHRYESLSVENRLSVAPS